MGPTVEEQFMLSREKQRPKLTPTQNLGTDMPDTLHTPTDTDTVITEHILHTDMPPTDTEHIIHTPMVDIIMENKSSNVQKILGMDAKRREYKIINYLLKITSFAKSKER